MKTDKCKTCWHMEQPEACRGCEESIDSEGWNPCPEIVDYFGENSDIYSELDWSDFGCFGCFDDNNKDCKKKLSD